MNKSILAVISAVMLAACTPVAVSEFNGESVKIQSPDENYSDVKVQSEATRLCAIKGKTAQYASTTQRYAPQYMSATWDHLFICV